ncbi:MAG: GntR family transcriptional regulator [Chloroflexia bacterium]
MALQVDTASPVPIYYQIREQLRRRILSGELRPGDPLPSEAQICAQCGVSRMTARLALSQLVSEGLVVRRKGRGTFVAPPKATFQEASPFSLSYTDLLERLGLHAGARIRRQEVVPAPPPVAEALRLEVGEAVVCIVRLRSADGQVMSLETSYLPQRLFPTLAELDLADRSLYRVLEEAFSLAPAYAVDTIELSTAGPYEAAELGIPEGMPVVLSTRVTYSEQDIPLVFTQTVHRGDRFRAVVRCNRRQLGVL